MRISQSNRKRQDYVYGKVAQYTLATMKRYLGNHKKQGNIILRDIKAYVHRIKSVQKVSQHVQTFYCET